MLKRKSVAIIIGLGVAVTISAAIIVGYRRAYEDGITSLCRSNMYQTAYPIASYYYANNHLPPARFHSEIKKEISYSWRAYALDSYDTFVDRDFPLRYDFNEPWDSPQNNSFMRRSLGQVFACPASLVDIREDRASYVAVVGKDTLWLSDEFRNLEQYDRNKLEEKILLIELPESDIHWTEPRDISLEKALELFARPNGLRGPHRHGGLFYITLRGRCRRISEIGSSEMFLRMLTVGPEDEQR